MADRIEHSELVSLTEQLHDQVSLLEGEENAQPISTTSDDARRTSKSERLKQIAEIVIRIIEVVFRLLASRR